VVSYERQWYRFEFGGKHYALRPADSALAPTNAWWPQSVAVPDELAPLLTGFIIGSWHPGGVTSNHSERDILRRQLVDKVHSVGGTAVALVTLQGGSQWAEPALCVSGIDEATAREIAEHAGQGAFIQMEESWRRPIILSGTKASGYRWQLVELPGAPCALSLGCELQYRPEREGGPWVSRSILVAGMWSFHHRLTHSLLSCDPCRTGAPLAPGAREVPGALIMLVEVLPASRSTYIATQREGDGPPARLYWPKQGSGWWGRNTCRAPATGHGKWSCSDACSLIHGLGCH
jgi:hypothetical protein